MTVLDRDRALASLEPVRRALLEDATAEGERLLDAARADADDILATARADVDQAVERARRKATASAAARRDDALTRARREAHASVLTARAELRATLVERVRAQMATLPDDPRYPDLIDHLTDLARQQLGDDAEIAHDPAGGIVATSGPRRVDYRLSALADRVVDDAGEEVAALWS